VADEAPVRSAKNNADTAAKTKFSEIEAATKLQVRACVCGDWSSQSVGCVGWHRLRFVASVCASCRQCRRQRWALLLLQLFALHCIALDCIGLPAAAQGQGRGRGDGGAVGAVREQVRPIAVLHRDRRCGPCAARAHPGFHVPPAAAVADVVSFVADSTAQLSVWATVMPGNRVAQMVMLVCSVVSSASCRVCCSAIPERHLWSDGRDQGCAEEPSHVSSRGQPVVDVGRAVCV
jgi:hypothetical protein